MKLILAALALIATSVGAQAPAMSGHSDVQPLDDKMALKELVDTFSNLADRKAVDEQVLLFTEDATVETISNGQAGRVLRGRQEIAQAFAAYLSQFDTVYHLNGQQTVTIDGDRATGTAYCLVVLIGMENGKRMKTTSGVIYSDQYVRRDGTWLIAKRVSNFTWREKAEIAALN